jgi:hypothetical protein
MKPEPPRAGAPKQRRHIASPRVGPQRAAKINAWGLRWHPGNFRRALTYLVLAAGVLLTFGQTYGGLPYWYYRDGYVATRATVVKAPFWADAIEPNAQDGGGNAGWHIELRVGDYPFALAVSLADFDPDKNSMDKKIVPDAKRHAVGSVHPVWFYANNKKMQPQTVALRERPPALVYSRATFRSFPNLREALEDSVELLIAPAALLFVAAVYLLRSFFGKPGGDAAREQARPRIVPAGIAALVAVCAWQVNSDHPLAAHADNYVPAELEIVRAPFAEDKLTEYDDYRVLWRTWNVEARLTGKSAKDVFTIDVAGLDPRRAAWASRHSPDFSALQAGARLAVWQDTFHNFALENLGSQKPTLFWGTFLSRERWPEKYTWRHFLQDAPVATVVVAMAVLMMVVWLVPLGFRAQLPKN